MQNINALIIDKNDRVGDNWRKRYHHLVLHDPVWYDHLPYLNFPPQWPVFTPKDKLAEWLESYASIMELNVWMKTEITSTKWDEAKKQWTITVARGRDDGSMEVRVFRPHHVIQATGQSGEKKQPRIQGMENFEGQRICHSSEFSGASEGGHGKKAVIVGCCTSGHDIAHDFVERGYEVTMVQRSSTTIVSSEAVTDIALKGLYSEDGPPIDDADLILHGMPNALLKALQVEVSKTLRNHDKDVLEGLTRAGFKLDDGPDGSGMMFKYFQRGGGYYIDTGTSKLIIDGKIKIKQTQQITEILPHGLKFADGSEIEADEVIFATGYESMRTQTRQIFGNEVADRLQDVWGFNDEGECRGLWQRTSHPGFWFHGGSMALCRYYSQLLALQIKGLEEKLYNFDEN
jgi:thioredoxin reductase